MFGVGNDDDERIRNFMLFKFYMTDKELKNINPYVVIVTIALIIGLVVWLV